MQGYKFIKKDGYFKLKTKKSIVIVSMLIASIIGAHAASVLLLDKPKEVVVQKTAQVSTVDTSKILVAWIRQQNRNISESSAHTILSSCNYWAGMYGLDPLLVLSLIKVESRFDIFAVSNSNALGLMQYIPRWHKEKIKEGTNPFDPNSNISVGTRILREYVDRHGSTEKALIQYNASLQKHEYASNVLKTRKELKEYLSRQAI